MHFTSPYYLLALLAIPVVIAIAMLVDRKSARYPVAFTNLPLLAQVASEGRRPWKRFIPVLLLVLALASAAAALARPMVKLSQADQNATVVLLVDVSGSMRASDVEPTRLDAAVAAMKTFLGQLPKQFKVGLVAFSTDPEPLVTPTTDRAALQESIELLEPEAGTALGDGIETALKMLQSSLHADGYVRSPGHAVPAAIVLLSDGAQNRGTLQPVQAARNAKLAGVRIYPVSLGTPTGKVSFGFGAYTSSIPVPPDPATMSEIASVSGGTAYTAQTSSSVNSIYRSLGSSVGRVNKLVQITSWFAIAAALLLLGAFLSGRLVDARLP